LKNINDCELIFDNIPSSHFELIVCKFDKSSGIERESIGSEREFTSSKPPISNKWYDFGSQYTTPFEITIALCKNDLSKINDDESPKIAWWLIRNDEKKWLHFNKIGYEDIFFKCSATKIEKITIGGYTYGMEITFICDSPFGYSSIQNKSFNINSNKTFTIYNDSHDIGNIYPDMQIHITQDCNLTITNNIENRIFKINNCTKNEIITIDGERKIITTSNKLHKIYNDFNWKYFRLVSNNFTHKNEIVINGYANIELSYRTVRKVGV
jgi:hypothetical protein